MEPVLPALVASRLVKRTEKGTIELTPLARVMAEHFIGINRLLRVVDLSESMDDPLEIIAELDCVEADEAAQQLRHPRRTDQRQSQKMSRKEQHPHQQKKKKQR
jgi:helicase